MVEVVVGVLGRAHGIRGEVGIDVRTDEPERRFVPGARLRVEGSDRTFTVDRPGTTPGGCWSASRSWTTAPPPRQARGLVLVTDVAADERPRRAEEYYDRQLVGLEAVTADGSGSGGCSPSCTCRLRTCWRSRPPPDRGWSRSSQALVPEVDLAGGTRGRRRPGPAPTTDDQTA